MEIKTIQTEDGSHSLYVPELDEHYHSTKGAIQESKHIFIEAGLHYISDERISILEVGFGTGLNAFYTLLEGERLHKHITYTGIEKYPLPREITSKLNFPDLLNANRSNFDAIHATEWEIEKPITNAFRLKKIEADLKNWNTNEVFDLIYFDAFGPDKQPNMWTDPIFQLMGKCLKSGGVLVTYSAKGDVRRGLQGAGMDIQKIPGPPGKKHITRAIKI
jgi:tRNA U34 5-methylaminomethyl-2-thiouridine-forming methyltransferase MnmC